MSASAQALAALVRLISANQYHLWCVLDPTFRFPFGFQERLVADPDGGPAGQRVFRP